MRYQGVRTIRVKVAAAIGFAAVIGMASLAAAAPADPTLDHAAPEPTESAGEPVVEPVVSAPDDSVAEPVVDPGEADTPDSTDTPDVTDTPDSAFPRPNPCPAKPMGSACRQSHTQRHRVRGMEQS